RLHGARGTRAATGAATGRGTGVRRIGLQAHARVPARGRRPRRAGLRADHRACSGKTEGERAMSLREQGRRFAERIDALSLRERAMLMIGAFMVMFLAWDGLLMSGVTARSETLNAQIETTRTGIAKLNEAIAIAAQHAG